MNQFIALGVCSANVQRSNTYETVLKYTLDEKNIDRIEIKSAGINVKKILSNTVDLDTMIKILDASLHYNLVEEDKKKEVELLINTKYPESDITKFYSKLRPLVHKKLVEYRNNAFEIAGIPKKYYPDIYTPFELKPDIGIILGMDKKTVDKLSKIPNQNTPIMTYGQLVGEADLKDDPKSGLKGAIFQVQYFMDTREKAITEMFKII